MSWGKRWLDAYNRSSLGKFRAAKDFVEYWNDRATWFQERTRGDTSEAMLVTSRIPLHEEMTLLDIGAGTGRFTIPLAPLVKSITAIEPSEGMRGYLELNLREAGIDNVRVVDKRWEDVVIGEDVEMHDVVIAAYSLGVGNVPAMLQKMNVAAKLYVMYFTWVKRTFWDYKILWPLVHGEPYVPGPDPEYLVKFLNELGIHPVVELFEKEKDKVFDGMDDILDDLKHNLHVQDDSMDEMLIDYIKKVTRVEGGKILHHGVSRRVLIYWNKP